MRTNHLMGAVIAAIALLTAPDHGAGASFSGGLARRSGQRSLSTLHPGRARNEEQEMTTA